MRTEELPNGEAERLVKHPIIVSILEELEQNAMDVAVNSNPTDDETKRSCMNEIRAIRTLRQRLLEIAKGRTKISAKGNVA